MLEKQKTKRKRQDSYGWKVFDKRFKTKQEHTFLFLMISSYYIDFYHFLINNPRVQITVNIG